MISLRPYQTEIIDRVYDSMAGGSRRVILQLPTGAGKTAVASAIIKRLVHKGNTAIFIADRRKLIDQGSSTFEREEIDAGIIMAGRKPDPWAPLQVATIQTIFARAIKTNKIKLPPVDLVLIDECHKSLGSQYKRLINEHYPDAFVLGLTATPIRTDGRGLREMYDDLVIGPSVQELQDQGYLVPTRYYAPSEPDMDALREFMDKKKGDYNEKKLGEYMANNTALIGDVVTNYKKFGEGRQAVVFASSVRHSKFITEAFNKAGIKAAHIDGGTPHVDRTKIYDAVHRGEIRVLSSVNVLTEGYDEPQISCCILARPTKSLAMFLQAAGRVLRPFPGKEDAIIIDHSGAVRELGFVEDERAWSLDDTETISEREDRLAAQAAKDGEENPEPERNIVCENCKTAYKGQRTCPNCGAEPPPPPPKPVDILEAELEELRREDAAYKRSFYARARSYELEKGLKGWAKKAYRLKFKNSPIPKIDKVEPHDEEIRKWHVHMKIKAKYSRRPRRWKKG